MKLLFTYRTFRDNNFMINADVGVTRMSGRRGCRGGADVGGDADGGATRTAG